MFAAVNKDGTGILCETNLVRFTGGKECEGMIICFDDITKLNVWVPKVTKVGKYGTIVNRIKVSKEVITKLVGHPITWDDEPVEIF